MTPSLCSLSSLHFLLFFFFISSFASSPSPHLRGLHPLEVGYFESELIKCKDGSNSFTRDRVNDDYCDCIDGTDEPGTSACANGKFYCKNLGSKPSLLFSSHVNDHICDCCDGSDEYDGVTDCPNTCVMGGTINYKPEHRHNMSPPNVVHTKEMEFSGKFDVLHYLKDLKVLIMIQLLAIIYVLGLWLFYRHMQSRRRRHR